MRESLIDNLKNLTDDVKNEFEKRNCKVPKLVYQKKLGQLMLIIDEDSYKIQFYSIATDSDIKPKYQEM